MDKIKWLIKRSIRETRQPSTALGKLLFRWPRAMLSRNHEKSGQDTMLAVYDLQTASITFNFVEYLVLVGQEALRRGKTGFHVLFVPREEDKSLSWKAYDSIYDEDSKAWRFYGILLPLTYLSPLCRGFTLLSHRSQIQQSLLNQSVFPPLYSARFQDTHDATTLYKSLTPGYTGLKAPIQAIRYVQGWQANGVNRKKYITLSIRDQKFDPARNTNIGECKKFLSYLNDKGYLPIIVPDTDNAWTTSDWSTAIVFHEAAWNLPLKMALYELAYVNFFSPNGSVELVKFNPLCSYIFMNFLPQGSIVTTPESMDLIGMKPGDQYRFAEPWQRAIWAADTLENYIAAFEQFEVDFPEWPRKPLN